MPSFSCVPLESTDGNAKASINTIHATTSPLFLPLNQLSPHCNRLLGSLKDDSVNRKELIALEQALWKEVKKLRSSQDRVSLFLYLQGYYHTILFQIANYEDPDDLFQYHILIRLGDLNRYLSRLETAEYYYCNARNLFPNFGHAYNQLGLMTKDSYYKCCYYYARSAKSSKRPLEKNLAESNLRLVLKEHESSILNLISNDDPNPSASNTGAGIQNDETMCSQPEMPQTAFDWFYVMVIAIYFDNIQPVAGPFMGFIRENFSTQRATTVHDGLRTTTINCDRDSYLLLASLDILLDWMKLGRQSKIVCAEIGSEMRQMRCCLNSLLDSIQNSTNADISGEKIKDNLFFSPLQLMNIRPLDGPGTSTPLSSSSMNVSDLSSDPSTKTSQSATTCVSPALPHDCVLKGYKPLEVVHDTLRFPAGLPVFNQSSGKLDEFGDLNQADQQLVDSDQLYQILFRIRSKIDSFGAALKRRTRNIALESILLSLGTHHAI